MSKKSFFCQLSEKCKDNYDIAVIKQKKIHGNREEITEKLFNFFSKYGMPTKINTKND